MHRSIATSTKPPPDSVPILSALQWLLTVQSAIRTFRQGLSERLLSTMPSSSESTRQPVMLTSLQLSIFSPSLLNATWLKTSILRIVSFSQKR